MSTNILAIKHIFQLRIQFNYNIAQQSTCTTQLLQNNSAQYMQYMIQLYMINTSTLIIQNGQNWKATWQ